MPGRSNGQLLLLTVKCCALPALAAFQPQPSDWFRPRTKSVSYAARQTRGAAAAGRQALQTAEARAKLLPSKRDSTAARAPCGRHKMSRAALSVTSAVVLVAAAVPAAGLAHVRVSGASSVTPMAPEAPEDTTCSDGIA